MPKLSIIIVNWNTAKLLIDCLNSLKSEIRSTKFETEIIVVDNGSTDNSVEEVKKLNLEIVNCKLKIIENKTNLGFAKGNNIGIKQAKGEYIMLLNSDTIVKERAMDVLVSALEKNHEIGAVSPLVLNIDGTIQRDPCYLKFPSFLFILFYYNRFLKNLANRYFPKALYSIIDFKERAYPQQLPGAAIIIKKNVLAKINGFDESFKIYFEDSDLCFRIKQEGYGLLFEPRAEIIHLGRQSIKPIIKKDGLEKFYLLNFESLFLFCKKHYSLAKFKTIKILVLTQILLSGKISLFKKLTSFK